MNIALWLVGVFLGLVFIAAGAMKLRKSKAQLLDMDPKNLGWAEDFSDAQINLISALELAGGLGLILPAVTGVATWLVPLAALGIGFSQIGATVVHVRRGERGLLPRNMVFLALALFVAWGRSGDWPL